MRPGEEATGATDASRSIPVALAAGGELLAVEHSSAKYYLDDFVIGLDGLCGIGSQQQQVGTLSGLNAAYLPGQAQELGVGLRGRAKDLQRCHPSVQHVLHLAPTVKPWLIGISGRTRRIRGEEDSGALRGHVVCCVPVPHNRRRDKGTRGVPLCLRVVRRLDRLWQER